MSLQFKYTDESGILHINMSPPSSSPRVDQKPGKPEDRSEASSKNDIEYPNFDTINKRFSHYDIFGGKYDVEFDSSQDGRQLQDGGKAGGETASEARSLFRSRYNSIEEELANTPYAFATERTFQSSTVRLNNNPILDITIESGFKDESPSKDLEDDRFFSRNRALNFQNEDSLFGPTVDFEVLSKSSIKSTDSPEEAPAFCVTQLIHAQDRYFDLSSKQSSVRTKIDAKIPESPKNKSFSSIKIESPSKIIKSEIRTSDTNAKSEKLKSEADANKKKSETLKVVPNLSINSVKSVVRSAPVSPKVVRPGQRTVKIVEQPEKLLKTVASDSKKGGKDAFKVLPESRVIIPEREDAPSVTTPIIPISKRKRESSFAIIAETPASSRPTSPRSLPVDPRSGRISPFKGRGFREETSRHATPRTSRHTTPRTSRSNSPFRRRTCSLTKLDKMAQVMAMPPVSLSRPHSPRNYIKENIEVVHEISEFNREVHNAETEKKKKEEEEALLREMGLLDKNANETGKLRSRSNSPSKLNLRSRSNSPSAILRFEKISEDSKDFVNPEDGAKPVAHKSRLRSVSKSQPESNNGSLQHSKIPKRQNSVSPTRTNNKMTLKKVGSNLNSTQRFISNSTSSIHESVRVGGDNKKVKSKSSQHLNISPSILKSKPPISPGKIGPPPTNKFVNPKRLSPIVGTPNKSPSSDKFTKPASARVSPNSSTGSSMAKKSVKTAGNTPATSRVASRNISRVVSRDPSPEKKRTPVTKTASVRNTKADVDKNSIDKPSTIKRTPSRSNVSKPVLPAKPEVKKPISRVNSVRNLARTNSTKTLIEKQENSKKNEVKKGDTTGILNNVSTKKGSDEKLNETKNESTNEMVGTKDAPKLTSDSTIDAIDDKSKQDNETQYETTSTNENGDLIPLTKMNVVSMTTAAITSQPLDVVTKVTNQLPAALEKAREKANFERISSNDSIIGKGDVEKNATLEKKSSKSSLTSIKEGDNVKMKPLQPPFNNPQVEKAKQKIDDILKNPEVSTENILNTIQKEAKPVKDTMKSILNTNKAVEKFADMKDENKINNIPDVKEYILKQTQKTTDEVRKEATQIVNSIMTPVETPIEKAKEIASEKKKEAMKIIEPVITIVNEKPKKSETTEVVEKMTEVIKGDPEVDVQSSNLKSPEVNKMAMQSKMADGSGSDKSSYSNGGFPKSTSTTPRPILPARTPKIKEQKNDDLPTEDPEQAEGKKQNLCQRLMGKCTKCSCCGKTKEDEEVRKTASTPQGSKLPGEADEKPKTGVLGKFSCCKKNASIGEEVEKAAELAAGKSNTIEFENESTKRKRGLSDILCGCCKRKHQIGDSTGDVRRQPTNRSGCCGRLACWKRKDDTEDWAMRRDSILSDQPPGGCCNNRACNWLRGLCCGRRPAEPPSSRRQSMFSKNKSLSPTLPVEDTRKKLDTSLVEHQSSMKGAIPVLPISLAYFCLVCNVLVPGLGTVFSGLLCLCFGIPRFGIHDGLKPRIGSFFINTIVGVAQLFTVLFCLVGWGWSIWWGTIMLKVARKYRKLRESAAADEERAPHVTTNNHHARA